MPPHDAPRLPRAERYPLVMPVRLRGEGESKWRAGQTCNVSLTGVLARFDGIDLPVGAAVEMVLGLTDEEPGARHVICVGHVVRFDGPAPGPRHVAATIERYRAV